VVGNLSSVASGTVQLVKDPLGTVNESVDYFLQDPLRNNPVAAVGRYYKDIAQASYVGDWETVANRVGSGTVTVLEVVGAEYALNKGVKTLKNKPSSKMSVKTTSVTNDIKTANTASHSGIRTQNRYALTGSEHYENLKSVFGADNVKWEAPTSNTTLTNINKKPVTYRRVQGGTPPNASQRRIYVNDSGNINIPNKKANLNISTGSDEHAKYFLNKRGPHAEIVEFEVPDWFDDFLKENSIAQKGYRNNPLNQKGTAPKVVDPTTPGTSYELPAPWIEWLEEYSSNGRIVK
jgi:hypothetical protein